MHDCPGCRVPLHGYEEVCPSCGMRQVRRSKQFSSFKPEVPGINWMPFVLTFFIIGIVVVVGMSTSWIGELATKGPPKEDPMAKMTTMEARGLVEQELTSGLQSAGATAKLSWADSEGKPVDKNMDQSVTLTVDTTLADPNARKPIMEKVSTYLEKAKISTVTMNDSKTHAHWTYNMVPAVGASSPDSEQQQ